MISTSSLTQAILDKRLAESTKYQYKGKSKQLHAWLYERHREFIDAETDDIILPLPNEVIESFFGHIMLKRNRDGTYKEPVEYCSFSHVSSFRSCIIDMYKQNNVSLDSSTQKLFENFVGGYNRNIAELKLKGEMSLTEGKRPITFDGYQFIASQALRSSNSSQSPFVFSFVLLCWNLMARSISVGSLMYKHISWEQDSLVICIPKHKGDQEGKRSHPKHVYANPINPQICPVLGLAVHVFSRGFQRDGSSPRVFGDRSEQRFSHWLSGLCIECAEAIHAMGLIIDEIGTHSFRKGIATFLGGHPGGPSSVAVWLRAGWSLGSVQSRYIFESAGGDQFVGRAATGLDVNSLEFSCLPPHFDIKDSVLTTELWEEILPGYITFYPIEFRAALPYLLASLVYHKNIFTFFTL
jgi:hypothetical protein